jgi:hypothetical protein
MVKQSVSHNEPTTELLKFSLRTKCLQVEDMFFRQRIQMAMARSLSQIVSNIYVEHFEKLALESAQHKLLLWLCYFEDTFVVWSQGPERLQNFHLPSQQFKAFHPVHYGN